MLRPDSANRRDIVTDLAIAIVAESGIEDLTVRALARRIGVTPAAVQQWVGPRAEMLVAITATFGQRWEAWLWRRSYERRILTMLPADEQELAWTRV